MAAGSVCLLWSIAGWSQSPLSLSLWSLRELAFFFFFMVAPASSQEKWVPPVWTLQEGNKKGGAHSDSDPLHRAFTSQKKTTHCY